MFLPRIQDGIRNFRTLENSKLLRKIESKAFFLHIIYFFHTLNSSKSIIKIKVVKSVKDFTFLAREILEVEVDDDAVPFSEYSKMLPIFFFFFK